MALNSRKKTSKEELRNVEESRIKGMNYMTENYQDCFNSCYQRLTWIPHQRRLLKEQDCSLNYLRGSVTVTIAKQLKLYTYSHL